jgi:hypothetical protein
MNWLLRLNVIGFFTNCGKQGIFAVTIEGDDKEGTIDSKSLCWVDGRR